MEMLGGAAAKDERLKPEREGWVLDTLTFTSSRKRASIAIKHPYVKDYVRIYCKGAPDMLIEK